MRKMLPLKKNSTITILGAGLMGRLLAVELARKGHRIEVFEAQGPDAQGSAARVAAAMLAPLAESAVTEPGVVRMGQALHHDTTGDREEPDLARMNAAEVFGDNGNVLRAQVLPHKLGITRANRIAGKTLEHIGAARVLGAGAGGNHQTDRQRCCK